MKKLSTIMLLVLTICAVAQIAGAQNNSQTAQVTITANKSEVLSLSAVISGTDNFNLDNPISGQEVLVGVTTNWNANKDRSGLSVCATTSGLGSDTGYDTIAASNILAAVGVGSATAMNAAVSSTTNCGYTTGKVIRQSTFTSGAATNRKGTATDNLHITLNPTLDVTAGNYSGTIDFIAVLY